MKRWNNLFLVLISYVQLSGAPPTAIPEELYDDFTLNGQIPVSYWYMDDSYSPDSPIIWTKKAILDGLASAKQRQIRYYHNTDKYLYGILDTYQSYIEGKTVGILGSVTPWYECIVLSYKGNPITIEYNKIISEDSRIRVMTVEEYEKNPIKFDVIVSISSIEHDGLGRYGDPVNPFGDIEAMNRIKQMLVDGGLLILAVPVGRDLLVWNAHRVYGPIRLPLLFNGWQVIDSSGFSEGNFSTSLEIYTPESHHQPVFVLQQHVY